METVDILINYHMRRRIFNTLNALIIDGFRFMIGKNTEVLMHITMKKKTR